MSHLGISSDQLQRVSLIDAEAAEDHVRRFLPFTIHRACESWPAFLRWKLPESTEYLSHLAGDAEIDLAVSSEAEVCGAVQGHGVQTTSFRDFIRQVSASSGTDAAHHLYLAQCPIINSEGPAVLPALAQDISVPPFAQARLRQACLWVSTRGTQVSVHFDGHQGYLCVLQGTKRVFLFPPAAAPHLHARPVWDSSPNHGAVSFAALQQLLGTADAADSGDAPTAPTAPSDETGQRERSVQLRALVRVADLAPGDGLFIPEGWWHAVESSPCTVAVNFWWDGWDDMVRDRGHMLPYFARRALLDELTLRRALPTAPPPATQTDTATADTYASVSAAESFINLLSAQRRSSCPRRRVRRLCRSCTRVCCVPHSERPLPCGDC